MKIVKKYITIKTNIRTLEEESKKQASIIRAALEKLCGWHPTELINDFIVEGVSYQWLRKLVGDDKLRVVDEKGVNNWRETNLNLVQIIPLSDCGRENEIISTLDTKDDLFLYKFHQFKASKFKVTRRGDHLLVADGNIVVRKDGSFYDPFQKSRKRI